MTPGIIDYRTAQYSDFILAINKDGCIVYKDRLNGGAGELDIKQTTALLLQIYKYLK